MPEPLPLLGVIQEVALYPFAFLFANGLLGVGLLTPLVASGEKGGMPLPVSIGIVVVAGGLLVLSNFMILRNLRKVASKCRAATRGYRTWALVWRIERREFYSGKRRSGSPSVSYHAHYVYLAHNDEVQFAMDDVGSWHERVIDHEFEPVVLDPKPPHSPFLADNLFPGTRMRPDGRFLSGIGWSNLFMFVVSHAALALVVYAAYRLFEHRARHRLQEVPQYEAEPTIEYTPRSNKSGTEDNVSPEDDGANSRSRWR